MYAAVRSERRGAAPTDFGSNRKRLEKARIALGWEKVPVLRNRRRALVVVESPLDTFGPATYDKDAFGFSARELVPAENPFDPESYEALLQINEPVARKSYPDAFKDVLDV